VLAILLCIFRKFMCLHIVFFSTLHCLILTIAHHFLAFLMAMEVSSGSLSFSFDLCKFWHIQCTSPL